MQTERTGKLRLDPLSIYHCVELERDIPQWGSLDRSCEVMVRKCRRHIDLCPGGRGTYQAVFKPERPQTGFFTRTENNRNTALYVPRPPGHRSICRLHFLTITSHDLSSEPHPGMPRSKCTYDHRENRRIWSFSDYPPKKLG